MKKQAAAEQRAADMAKRAADKKAAADALAAKKVSKKLCQLSEAAITTSKLSSLLWSPRLRLAWM